VGFDSLFDKRRPGGGLVEFVPDFRREVRYFTVACFHIGQAHAGTDADVQQKVLEKTALRRNEWVKKPPLPYSDPLPVPFKAPESKYVSGFEENR
jgi:hypothetical protein